MTLTPADADRVLAAARDDGEQDSVTPAWEPSPPVRLFIGPLCGRPSA